MAQSEYKIRVTERQRLAQAWRRRNVGLSVYQQQIARICWILLRGQLPLRQIEQLLLSLVLNLL